MWTIVHIFGVTYLVVWCQVLDTKLHTSFINKPSSSHEVLKLLRKDFLSRDSEFIYKCRNIVTNSSKNVMSTNPSSQCCVPNAKHTAQILLHYLQKVSWALSNSDGFLDLKQNIGKYTLHNEVLTYKLGLYWLVVTQQSSINWS